MKKYIIIDSNNNWLATDTDKKDAIKTLGEFADMGQKGKEYEGMDIGNEIFLFEAVEITKVRL